MMKRLLHLLLPVLVYYLVSLPAASQNGWFKNATFEFWPNYILMAAPQILWLVVSLIFCRREKLVQLGFAGADVALIVVGGLVFIGNQDAAYGWLLYWPLSAVLMFTAILFGSKKHPAKGSSEVE
jgi:signal transduction histidine kinase